LRERELGKVMQPDCLPIPPKISSSIADGEFSFGLISKRHRVISWDES
jgi:hypothetical protein